MVHQRLLPFALSQVFLLGKMLGKKRPMGKLTARQVQTLNRPGRHSDGNNLYLNVSKGGTKSWVFFYRFLGRQKEMGLGSATLVSLAEARSKALQALKTLKDGTDPLAAKRAALKEEASKISFGEFADAYLVEHIPKYKHKAHKRQWQKTFTDYCASIRAVPLSDVDTEKVLKVLRPLWSTTSDTARKVRGRIEALIDAAKAQNLFQGDNPARWKGHLKSVLPLKPKLANGHHPALPYDDIGAFLTELRAKSGSSTAALALEYCILTVTRSGETLGALWSEVDVKKAIWVIPGKRMKAGMEHRIPLSARAVKILKKMEKWKSPSNQHIFPGNVGGKGLSNMSMTAVLRRMKRDEITVHGFRSTFRDWASEQTSFPNETCEHVLAHRISDQAEAAYRRGDQFDKRRKLMENWADFCGRRSGGKASRRRA